MTNSYGGGWRSMPVFTTVRARGVPDHTVHWAAADQRWRSVVNCRACGARCAQTLICNSVWILRSRCP